MKALLAALFAAFIVNAGCYRPVTNNITHRHNDGELGDLEEGVDLSYAWYSPQDQKGIKDELNVSIPNEKPPLSLEKLERKEVILGVKTALSDRVETAKKVDKSAQNMIRLAGFMLRKKGFYEKASEIETIYANTYQNYTYMYALGGVQDIGDHPPMWEWLDKLEKDLRNLLGDFIMRVTRLEDLRTFNYAIPIVMHPDGDTRTDPVTLITKLDYKQHFVPFAGALGYWTAWGVCTGATWGLGAVVFICSPIGMIAERVIEQRIAPDMADKIWERYNN